MNYVGVVAVGPLCWETLESALWQSPFIAYIHCWSHWSASRCPMFEQSIKNWVLDRSNESAFLLDMLLVWLRG